MEEMGTAPQARLQGAVSVVAVDGESTQQASFVHAPGQAGDGVRRALGSRFRFAPRIVKCVATDDARVDIEMLLVALFNGIAHQFALLCMVGPFRPVACSVWCIKTGTKARSAMVDRYCISPSRWGAQRRHRLT